ncbi:hypothetical protein NDU88_008719 [Pleurodeles waltl]|uniref:Uncharacterized protein n=1 Tax=Pleurodeles waltl TaxID=8319 RepID=A0AAV7NYM0_PLEWA|nr:hypothetical protein NDU88_008719 [Pleurodeles waltl]
MENFRNNPMADIISYSFKARLGKLDGIVDVVIHVRTVVDEIAIVDGTISKAIVNHVGGEVFMAHDDPEVVLSDVRHLSFVDDCVLASASNIFFSGVVRLQS